MTLKTLGYDFSADRRIAQGNWIETPDGVRKAAGVVTAGLAIALSLVAIAVVLSWFGWLSI
jgi:phycobilisome rod-core linker protein